jgi:hypothetical protein
VQAWVQRETGHTAHAVRLAARRFIMEHISAEVLSDVARSRKILALR